MKTQTKPKVLITNTVPPSVLEPLAGLADVIMGPNTGDLMTREEVLRLAPEITAIINQAELRVDAGLLDVAKELKIVVNVALGTDNLDLPLMTSRGVWAANAPGTFVESTADCTFALLLAVTRRLVEADAYVRSGAWKSFQPGIWDGMELHGKTLGIVGFGKIGRAVARRAEGFGLRVLFFDPSAKDDPRFRELDELLPASNIVSLHIPLLPETHHIMNSLRFARMKAGGIFINMARGKTMDEAALVSALQSGHLAGAGLDVFEDEPVVHPALPTMKNVVLTPHIGGGTRESREATRRLACENVAAVLQGREPVSPVNRLP
ncbi:MAG: D-glycerate dehydrogenase [Verrucomicrobia bacterium]|nr:D-glycerate dehydrogenase [Verrucomicrobiota bacterium]